MFAGLFVSAALLGLAGGLHCVGMCGAAGAALCGGAAKPAFRWWNVARVLSYALAGALVGGGAQGLLTLASRWPALHAAWVMLQFAALAVALLMLLAPQAAAWHGLAGSSGWMPVTLGALGAQGALEALGAPAQLDQRPRLQGAGPLQPHLKPQPRPQLLFKARSMLSSWGALTGLLWAGFPCGLLHGALLMAWMSGSAAGGVFVMVLFGSASAAWLLAGAGLMRRLRASGVWTEARLRRLTGAVLLLSWLAMAVGAAGGAGAAAGLGGLFCMPVR